MDISELRWMKEEKVAPPIPTIEGEVVEEQDEGEDSLFCMDEDQKNYNQALGLLDEANDLLILFEEVKLKPELRRKLIDMRREISHFMTYEDSVKIAEKDVPF